MREFRALLLWTLIGAGLLFFGGLAFHGYRLLMTPCTGDPCAQRVIDWLALGHLAIGGGVATGLIGLTLTLASPRGVGWGLGMMAIGFVLFLIFVWPTPYTYYRTSNRQWIQVHRLTGESQVLPGSQTAASSNQR